MTARTRKTTTAAAEETPATAPMECVVKECTEPESDGQGICAAHHEAGWRYVKEPENA